MKRVRWLTIPLLAVLLGVALLLPLSVSAASSHTESSHATSASTNSFTNIPVTGTVAAIGGTFNGTLNITRFAVQNGQLVAHGLLSGTLTNAAGTVVGTVTNVPVTIPLAAAGTCQILHLTLGPLDLNLLGLMVHLDRVVLDITAQQGPGNLLGNLLCAIANLLNNPGAGALHGVANLLNRILALL